MKKLAIILSIVFLSFNLSAQVEFYRGTATSRQGELQYIELHTMTYEGDKLLKVETRYHMPDNKEFASLISVFSSNPLLPDSTFKDLRTGKNEVTKVEGDKYQLTIIDKDGKSSTKSLKIEKDMLCGQGYHNYLRTNLNNFKLNEEKVIKFVLPSRQDYYSFDLALIKESDDKKTFKLSITNWILKIFADSIEVDYDNQGNLLAYRGLSNIQDESGRNMDVLIQLKKVEKLP